MRHFALSLVLAACLSAPGAGSAQSGETLELTDAQMEDLVRRSYQYVAMFNVNDKFALDPDNPMTTGGYNRTSANTELTDHRLQAIARPNNDTLYTIALIDVTEEPVVLEMPAFDSTYVSLMVTAYDHYVNIPMSTTKGDFSEPATMLFYSERTPDYDGEPVEGVDMIVETTGDFVSAVFRVMPHAAEPERMERNLAAKRYVDVEPLSEFLGQGDKEAHVRSWGSPRGISRNLDLREDSAPMNPLHDYEILMTVEELPPVKAFWSTTLYENETGFFIPNDRFKYSVGENAGFTLDEDGDIRIVIAAEQPDGVPEENWLPINREDMDLDIIMRLYAPDLEKYKSWTPPKAKKL